VLADSPAFVDKDGAFRLDVIVAASGFTKTEAEKLEKYMDGVNKVEGVNEVVSEEEEEEMTDATDSDAEVMDGVVKSDALPENSDGPAAHAMRSESQKDQTETDSSEEGSDDDEERDQRRVVRSQCPSPTDSLIEHTAALGLSDLPSLQDATTLDSKITDEDKVGKTVTKELVKKQAREKKFHTKGGSRRIGRSKGSKAKQGFRYQAKDHESWG